MTILGRHTVRETLEFIKGQDFRFDKYNEAFKSISTAYRNTHANEYEALGRDWTRIYDKWKSAARRLTLSLKVQMNVNPLVSADVIPAESEWVEANAFFLNGKEPGGMRDCEFRIDKALGTPVDVDTGRPLQNAPDTDIILIKELDSTIKAGEAAAAKAGEAAKSAAKSNIGYILAGGAVILVGTVVATKIYL